MNVRVVDTEECHQCRIKGKCCALKSKASGDIVFIENSGRKYRMCKTKEFAERQKKLEIKSLSEEERVELQCKQLAIEQAKKAKEPEERNRKPREEREIEKAYTAKIPPEERNRELRAERELEKAYTAKIPPEERTCFRCKNKLSWMRSGDSYVYCGIGSPHKAHPETAVTCRSFLCEVPKNKSLENS